ncbi:MAG: hypothetical protein JWP25_8737 [Bradyrhizobium sp.]|jgi:hypothetical protein|nr:hypothetical protein [Bradyrhizobium sp.]MEA2866244.1 hypothetical protein [Bradyrhizobium sp.]
MCNCTSGNLEIPDRRFASSGMTPHIPDLAYLALFSMMTIIN